MSFEKEVVKQLAHGVTLNEVEAAVGGVMHLLEDLKNEYNTTREIGRLDNVHLLAIAQAVYSLDCLVHRYSSQKKFKKAYKRCILDNVRGNAWLSGLYQSDNDDAEDCGFCCEDENIEDNIDIDSYYDDLGKDGTFVEPLADGLIEDIDGVTDNCNNVGISVEGEALSDDIGIEDIVEDTDDIGIEDIVEDTDDIGIEDIVEDTDTLDFNRSEFPIDNTSAAIDGTEELSFDNFVGALQDGKEDEGVNFGETLGGVDDED